MARLISKLGASDVRGDAYITVKVKIPTSVSGKEKELVEQINTMNGGRTGSGGSGGGKKGKDKKKDGDGGKEGEKKKGFFGI